MGTLTHDCVSSTAVIFLANLANPRNVQLPLGVNQHLCVRSENSNVAACVYVLLKLLSPSQELLVQSPCKTQQRNEKMEDFNMDVAPL